MKEKAMVSRPLDSFKAKIICVTALLISLPVCSENNNDTGKSDAQKTIRTSVKADYIQDCRSGNCASTEGSIWSNEHPNGVAISVAQGTTSNITDEKIRSVLVKAFLKYGISNIKFYFEKNDAPSTGISFHVRGGTDGPHFVNGEIFNVIREVASKAKHFDPVLQD
jgi:hypothetical protein